MSSQPGGPKAARTNVKPLELAVNHIVLPPRLPGQQDPNQIEVETIILNHVLGAVDELARLLGGVPAAQKESTALINLINTINLTRTVHGEHLDRDRVKSALEIVGTRHHGLVLHVREQNAAIIIRHDSK
jgi:hypothetical protein